MKIKKETKRISKRKIIILLPFWSDETLKEKVEEYSFDLIKMSIPENFGYVYYEYSDDLLNSNPYLTRKNFNSLISLICADLKKIKSKHKEKEFYIYAQSLGGLFAMIISDKIEIKKITLICPGDNLAECFWHGIATQVIRRNMQKKQEMDLEKLKKIWAKISPDYYFKNKSRKTRFYIELSKTDKIIPRKNGKNLIKLLKKKHVSFEISKVNFPHQIALLYDSVFSKKSLDFLTKK